MSTRLIRINCNGTIHDDDNDPFGNDEQEDFSWSQALVLENNSFSKDWEQSHTVDGEVKLKAKLRMQVDSQDKLSVSGTLELWEGPGWNMGASKAIDNTIVEPGTTVTIYEGKLEDDEDDWAQFKLEVQNADNASVTQPLTDATMQNNWRWCSKCQGLFFAGSNRGVCPAGGTHTLSGSGNYSLAINQVDGAGQHNWRWCKKCQGLFFAGNSSGACPQGGSHDQSGSGDYTLLSNTSGAAGQHNWRWCKKCQGLFFAGNSSGVCPQGGSHDQSGSGDYVLTQDANAAPWIDVAIQWQSTWAKGWTHFAPFWSGTQSSMIAYNKSSGAAAFIRFKHSGRDPKITGYEILAEHNLDSGWTHLVPFEGQSGINYLIKYNAQTGQVRFDRIKADGTGIVNVALGNWASGWNQLTVLKDQQGVNYLVVYDVQTGRVRFDRIAADGTGTVNVEDGTWARVWNSVKGFSASNHTPYLLVYDKETGRLCIDHFSGNSSRNVYDGVMVAGASHLEMCSRIIIAYNRATGYTEFCRIKEHSYLQAGLICLDIVGYDIVFAAEWAVGWSDIVPFKVPYRSGDFIQSADRILFYNAENGMVHVDKVVE